MALSKSLMTVLAVLLLAGGGVAAVGMAQTDAGAATDDGVSALSMDATLDNGTVAVTVADDGTPVGNASLTVEGEEEATVVTDADGVGTVNASALAEDGESIEELEVSYETDHAEGELEYVVENGSLTLVEEEYEYEVEEEEAEEGEETEQEAEGDDESEEADEEEAEDDEGEEYEEDKEESEQAEDEEDENEEYEEDEEAEDDEESEEEVEDDEESEEDDEDDGDD